MKRNNVAKHIGIASLCLGAAISAFSGISSFNKNVRFSGEAEDVAEAQVKDLVTVSQGATAGVENRDARLTNNTALATNQPCLRISSEVAYEATFNRIFQNNTELRFAFPDTAPDGATTTFYGDFKFRITDATDENDFFDIVYRTTEKGTTMYVEWNKNKVQANVGTADSNSGPEVVGTYKYNSIETDSANYNVAPAFMKVGGDYGVREGKLTLSWSAGVLSVITNSTQKGDAKDKMQGIVAKFDGSYDPTATKNGFVNGNKWGLPKLSFPNGYKISFSSSYTNPNEGATDNATDVSFWKIANDGKTYTFGDTAAAGVGNNYMQAYDLIEANAGKALLGWKDAENALYPTAKALKSADISVYTPVFLGFDTINGASVRIESAGESGIRFMTIFDVNDYAAAKSYITSFGTLITYTDTLKSVKKDFTIDNYTGVATFAQVVNKKGVFTYTDNGGNQYKAYSMALVDIKNYAKAYSARGYLEVTYADTTKQIIYTDYNETDNSRSIAEVAHLLTQDTTAYEALTDERKAIVDTYAAAYVSEE